MNQKKTKEEIYLSIIIPAYNEEDRIKKTLEHIFKYLSEKSFTFEFVIVDDGCTDETIDIVKNTIGDKDYSFKIVKNDHNMGKGFSIKKGVIESSGKFLLFSDADMSTPIEEFDKMIPFLEGGSDIVIGSRALNNSDIRKRQIWYREMMGKIFNFFVQLLVLKGIKDTQCGFKAFKADDAKRIFTKMTIYRFGFDVELLYLARILNLKITEVPIIWINSPASKVRCVTDSLSMFMSLIKIRYNRLIGIYKNL